MMYKYDFSKSLSEIDDLTIEQPEYKSHLIQACEELYHKPLKDFSIEDLRIMIGQNIGLIYLIPLAIEELQINPLVSGELYSGDLLHSVLTSNPAFWRENVALRNNIKDIICNTISNLNMELESFLNSTDDI